MCWLALKEGLKPRNFSGRLSAGSIIFDPSYTSPERLSTLKEKEVHLETKEGISNMQQKFLPLYDCYASIFKKNLEERPPREGSNTKQAPISDDLTSLMVEYISP